MADLEGSLGHGFPAGNPDWRQGTAQGKGFAGSSAGSMTESLGGKKEEMLPEAWAADLAKDLGDDVADSIVGMSQG